MRFFVAAFVLFVLLAGGTSFAQPLTPEETFPTSLHATRPGKAHLYAAQRGGFEQLTGVPMADLPCTACHAPTRADGTPIDNATYKPDCTDCHKQAGDKVADSVCLGCHQRQGLERTRFPDDVHAAAGFTCMNCHTQREMHGDGTSYVSQLQQGATDAKCQNCHQGMPTNIEAHDAVHMSSLDCNACHAQSVITCNDCHFDSQVEGGGRRYYAPAVSGFTYLVRREGSGKIHTATMQTLVYKDKSFVVIAPYTAPSIPKKARTCADCHNNANLRAYSASGKMAITHWDASANKLKTISGVVPVPLDQLPGTLPPEVEFTGRGDSPLAQVPEFVRSRFLLSRMKKIVTISRHIRDRIIAYFPKSARRTSIIYYGIDLDKFKPENIRRGAIRSRFGLPPDTRIIGTVGDLWKNQVEFLDALVLIRKEIPGARFALVASESGTGQIEVFKQRATELGLTDAILWTGRLSKENMLSFYADIDVAVSTHRNEGFGIWVLEALAVGTPIVSVNEGGIRDSLEGCPAGVLVDGGPERMADAVINILKDPAGHKRMAEAGPRWTAERFSRGRMIEDYFGFFQSLFINTKG